MQRFADHWRREKARRDSDEQREAIRRYARERAPVGEESAAEQWCARRAAMWRAERESLERNGFVSMAVTVRNPGVLHMLPWSQVATAASRHDCDVYVHRPGMPCWNFLLEGRPFMNVKSVLGLLSLGIMPGDTLEVIATGAEARQALEAVRLVVED